MLFLSIALSVTVMVDLNRPEAGWARELQEPMKMLLQSLKSQPPAAFDRFSGDFPPPAR